MISFKDFFSFKKNRFFWLNLAGMVIVVIIVCWGTLFWLDRYTHHGESYLVHTGRNRARPETTGRSESERRTNRLPHRHHDPRTSHRPARPD